MMPADSDTLFKQAAKRKRKKYFDLCDNCNHDVLLITLEVGSRGVIHLQGFLQMQKHLDCSKKDLSTLGFPMLPSRNH